MIIITHWPGQPMVRHDRGVTHTSEYEYALGFKPPNYPVPAIRKLWQWDSDGPFLVEYVD